MTRTHGEPDCYLTSRDVSGDLAKVRECWRVSPIRGPGNEFLHVRVSPSILGQPFGLGGEDIREIILSPRHAGYSLLKNQRYPLAVHIYRALDAAVFRDKRLTPSDVEMIGWGELFQTHAAASSAIH